MCEPTTAMMAIAAVSAGVNAYSTHQSAKAQAEAMEIQAENERREVKEAAEEELGQRIRAAREQRARARVAAGESGSMGQSFAAMLNQSLQDQDGDAALAAKNVALQRRAIDDRLTIGKSQIRDISALEAGLQIASAGVQGYNTGLSIRDARAGQTR